MTMLADLKARLTKTAPFHVVPRTRGPGQWPTYGQAAPAVIDAAVRRAQRRPSGNWYAFAVSDSIRTEPLGTSVAGIELVAWRGQHGTLHVGPGACPHLGAELATGRVDCGTLICPWHGLRLDATPRFCWRTYPSHDDGIMAWVRLDSAGAEPATDTPVLGGTPRRPAITCRHKACRHM